MTCLKRSLGWHCATSRTVPGSIPSGVTGSFFFRGSLRRNHVPWGRLSLWKWVLGISPGVKAAGAYGWRHTTLVVPNVKKIRGLNLPGTTWATAACCGMTLTFYDLTCLEKQNSCKSHIFCKWGPLSTVTFEHGAFKSQYRKQQIMSTSGLGSITHMILET